MSRRFPAATLMLTLLSWLAAFAQPTPVEHPEPTRATIAAPVHAHSGMHPCCRPLGVSAPVAPVPLPAGMPCGDRHSCCVRPGTQNTPNLPSTSGNQRPAAEAIAVVTADDLARESSFAIPALTAPTLQSTSTFSTVLRN